MLSRHNGAISLSHDSPLPSLQLPAELPQKWAQCISLVFTITDSLLLFTLSLELLLSETIGSAVGQQLPELWLTVGALAGNNMVVPSLSLLSFEEER